jgi:prevent-host-death family protein
VDIGQATGSLSDYAREANNGTVVVTRHGKPIAAVVPLDDDAWEDLRVSTDPDFARIIARSEERYRREGDVPLEKLQPRQSPRKSGPTRSRR